MKMIYVLLCVLALLVIAIWRFAKSRSTHESFESSSPQHSLVKCLSLPEARQVFLSDDFSFHKDYSRAESIAKTKITNLPYSNWHAKVQQCYLDNVQDFSDIEKEGLTSFIEQHKFLKSQPWKFIKMADHMDFSFPYTLGDSIVLPGSLVKSIADNRAPRDNFKTLCHENLHILQRSNPSAFRKYYESAWNYDYDANLFIPEGLRVYLVTNPDGYEKQGGWIAKIGQDEYYYCLCLAEDNVSLSRRAYKVINRQGSSRRVVDDSNYFPLDQFSQYQHEVRSCYHPNEEYAYLMSQKYTEKYFGE